MQVSFDRAAWLTKLQGATVYEHIHECLNELEYLCFPTSDDHNTVDAAAQLQAHAACMGEHLVWAAHPGSPAWPARIAGVDVFRSMVKVEFFGDPTFSELSVDQIQEFSSGFVHMSKQRYHNMNSFLRAVKECLVAYAEYHGKSWLQAAQVLCDGEMAYIDKFLDLGVAS